MYITCEQWLNDLEHDDNYARWQSSLYSYLQPSFSMLRQLRRNVLNIVLFVDPLDARSRPLIRIAEAFTLHMLPVRFAFVTFVLPL